MLLYVEVFNEFYYHNSVKQERLFNVNDKEDVIQLLSKPYNFEVSDVCKKITDAQNDWKAHFLYNNGVDGLLIVTDKSLIEMLQNDMVDIVKDVLMYTDNEVYRRFFNCEIFGLICKE